VIGTLRPGVHIRHRSLAWSPNSRRIAVARSSNRSGDVTIWDPEAGKECCTLGPMSNPNVSWSPDGTRLAMTDLQQNCEVWDVGTGKRAFTVKSGAQSYYQDLSWSVWSPDGKRLLLAAPDAACIVVDPTTGEKVLSFGGGGHWVYAAEWS